MTRRRFLAGASAAVLTADLVSLSQVGDGRSPTLVMPSSALVVQTEARRAKTGRIVTASLLPRLGQVDLGGRVAQTWVYDDQLPGKELRLSKGDQLRVQVTNALPQPTSVHWHGIAIRCDMDGVPGMTEPPLDPTGQFVYQFTVPDAGTYWYHPHVGTQRDRGLYGPLVVEDPHDPVDVDVDLTVMIDDWIDGLGTTPDAVLARLQAGQTGGSTVPALDPGSPWGPMLGDIAYPLHLINGRPATDPPVVTARPGQRLRLRLINAGADTSYRVALDGQPLRVVAADGWDVEPIEVPSLLIGMAERYDIVVTATDGVVPLVAVAEGKVGAARLLIRGGTGPAPPVGLRPPGLAGPLLRYDQLIPRAGTELAARRPDRHVTMVLGRDTSVPWRWTIDGATFPDSPPVTVHPGERIRITFVNQTDMAHPMHTHGHTFALPGRGTRKDTAVVLAGGRLTIDLEADNPGQWMFHCHDEYHLLGGMATVISYVT